MLTRFRFPLALLLSLRLLLGLTPSQAQTLPAGQGQVADSTELRVLRQFYYATGGDSWVNNTGWLQGNTVADAASWNGITVSNGDVSILSLSGNGLQCSQLPVSLAQLSQLQSIRLAGNKLSGSLPAAWGQLTQLQDVDLSFNQLTGSLPAAWGQLTQLHHLYLYVNHLSGSLPAAWSHLTQLQVIWLVGNQLSGSLPAAWGQLTQLQVLWLAANQLSGSLPAAWGQLTQLQVMYLDGNQLSGSLPAAWGQLTQLQDVDLGDNQLSGSLSPAWGQLAQLEYLNLSNNQLSGSLPASILLLPRLNVLSLNGNNLTGLPVLANSAGLNVEVDLENNQLNFAALERLYRGPQQCRLGYVDAIQQRPPSRVDTLGYELGQPLQLLPPDSAAPHGYAYQWQRLVGGQWTDMPGDTLLTKSWSQATAAEQGTYRRVEHDRWFTDGQYVPTELYSRALYADLLPYKPLAQNRPDDTNRPTPAALPSLPVARDTSRTGDVNFVRSWSPRVALTDSSRVRFAPVDSVAKSTQYLDGLGRPIQTVLHQASPQRNDVVQPQLYDGLGREPYQFLPYAAAPVLSRQGFHANAVAAQDTFYRRTTPVGGGMGPLDPHDPIQGIARTSVAYGETQFEASPLNRVTAQAAPGETWRLTGGHIVEHQQRPNTAQDSVVWFRPGYDPTSLDPGYQGYYAPGELWGVQSRDEHGFYSLEWKDKLGQVVLKQVQTARLDSAGYSDSTGTQARRWLRTAYVYDDFGHLRFVLQPEATKSVLPLGPAPTAVPASIQPYLFHYRYDGRGRQIAKLVPGQDGETLVVYDQLNRPVLSQDASQRQRQEWSWTKYDALGRVVLSGLTSRQDTLSQVSLQAIATADTATAQYEQRTPDAAHYPQYLTTDQSFPQLGQGATLSAQGFTAGQVLSATYYDDYDFDNDGQADVAYDTTLDGRFPSGQAPVADALRTTGMVTRTLTRVLGVADNDPIQAAWLTTTTFYDERARPVQVQTSNARLYGDHQPGRDVLTTQLDFTGKVVQSVASHQGPNLTQPLVVKEQFSYDHTGRLLTTRQQLPGEARPALLDSVSYNEIGQVVRKTLGTGRLRQNVAYAYNIRGWLTSLNDPYALNPTKNDLFSLSLHYEQGFTKGYEQYNGNLTGQTWRGRDGVQRAYGYVYDATNRLLQGDFVARQTTMAATPSAGAWTAEQDNYRLSFVSYDDNGNILTLRRRGLLQNATHATSKQYGAVDNLSYAYQGNRLQAVDDAVTGNQLPRPTGYNGAPTSLAGDFQEQGVKLGQEYLYDANGNLTQDKNKGITGILYNHLNLPRQIHFGQVGDSVVFRYTASGHKVAKLVYQTGKPVQRTDYLGPYQYEGDSLRFFPHAEGRVLRFVSIDPAGAPHVRYQREFAFKDHLGNLRLAYRAGQVRTLTATLEQDSATRKRETQQFDSLSVSQPIAVATVLARSGGWAAKLNAGGATPQPLGPLTQLGVQKGDTVTVTAYGHYPQAQQSGLLFSLASFITNLLHPASPPPAGLEAGRRKDLPLLQVGLSAGLASLPQLSGGVPQAYLRLLVFDKDSVLLKDQCQVVQLTDAASSGLNKGYEQLQLHAILPQDGYVTAYVGSQSNVDVFFDDITVEHRQGLQIQENQYDPWGIGLVGVNYSSPSIQRLNQYQFNGKERQLDLGLGWSDYGARFYDPARGPVWFGVDLLADVSSSWSPYAFSMDNSVLYTDMTGMSPGFDSEEEPAVAPHKGFQSENPSHYIAQGGPSKPKPIPTQKLNEVVVTHKGMTQKEKDAYDSQFRFNNIPNWADHYMHDNNYLREAKGPFGNGEDELPFRNSDGTLGRGGQIFFGTIGFVPALLTGGAAYEVGGATWFLTATGALSSLDMTAQGVVGLDKTPLTYVSRKAGGAVGGTLGGQKGARIGSDIGEGLYTEYDGVINALGFYNGITGMSLKVLNPQNAGAIIGTGASGVSAANDGLGGFYLINSYLTPKK